VARIESLLQRIQHKVRAHGRADAPTPKPAREHIDHKRDIQPALPGRDVGKVRHPQLIRPIRPELLVDPIQRTRRSVVGNYQNRIALGTCAKRAGIALLSDMAPKHGRGNPQGFAHRLDPVGIVAPGDEIVDDLSRRSSSAWAKNALSSFRISSTRRSSLFSRSRALRRFTFVPGDAIAHTRVDLVLVRPAMQGL
jgi:hypothetical protein